MTGAGNAEHWETVRERETSSRACVKENYSESIEQIQPKQNSRRTKKSQAACLRSGSDDTEVRFRDFRKEARIFHKVKSFLREFDPGSG